MTTHYLKTLPQNFQPSLFGNKPFEIRFNDRNFQLGDVVILKEWSMVRWYAFNGYSGRELRYLITHVTSGTRWGLVDNFVCLGLAKLGD